MDSKVLRKNCHALAGFIMSLFAVSDWDRDNRGGQQVRVTLGLLPEEWEGQEIRIVKWPKNVEKSAPSFVVYQGEACLNGLIL